MEKLKPILDKLKGVLNHLEKVIFGLVLIAVATLSVMELLSARKEMATAKEKEVPVTLRGGDYELDPKVESNFKDLITQASGSPDPLVMEGSNHWVYNPRKWKEIAGAEGEDPVLVPDTDDNPLGVSALTVTNIAPVNLFVTPVARLALDNITVQYTFNVQDNYPIQWDRRYGNAQTFVPHIQLQPVNKPASQRLTFQAGRKPIDLHAFRQYGPAFIASKPDWRVQIKFTAVTPPIGGNVNTVTFGLDVIHTEKINDQYITSTNSYPRVQSQTPIAITRAYEADFMYQTKFHPTKAYENYREGRHIHMDGEAIKVLKITRDEVHLYSDLDFGGNGKLYIKKLVRPGGAPVVAAPVANPNAPATNAPAGP